MSRRRFSIVSLLLISLLLVTAGAIVSASVNYNREDPISSVDGYTWREMGFSEKQAFLLGFYMASGQKSKSISEIPEGVNSVNNYYNSGDLGKPVGQVISSGSQSTPEPSPEFIRISINRMVIKENTDCGPAGIVCTGTPDPKFIIQACGEESELATWDDPEMHEWHDLSLSREFNLGTSSSCRIVIKMQDDDTGHPAAGWEILADTSFHYDTSEGSVSRRVMDKDGGFIYRVEVTG